MLPISPVRTNRGVLLALGLLVLLLALISLLLLGHLLFFHLYLSTCSPGRPLPERVLPRPPST